MAERFDTWPHDATGIVKEALREYVGDGDGEDERVLAAHNAIVAAKALRDAASERAVMQYQGLDYPVRAVPLAVLFEMATRIERGA